MIDFVWLIPAIMFLAALINGLGVRKLGEAAGYISAAAMISTFLLSAGVFYEVVSNAPHLYHGHGDHGETHAEHADHDHSEHAHGGAAVYSADNFKNLSESEQKNVKARYFFVRTNPDDPKPWDTEFRDGMGGYVKLWTWIDIPGALGPGQDLVVDMAFHVDQLTAIFLMFISFVGSLVFIYATGYMREEHHGKIELDPGYARFFSYLALFAGSMYTLILGANFVVMFIGWEGVGLCSYLLIGYYFQKQFNEKLSCSDAGNKAFIVNRVGDFGLMLGMFMIFWGLGTLDFQEVIHKLSVGDAPAGFLYGGGLITVATLLLFLGATGKSAQIPLFVWLPDAMAGPTPVSALIHAATMVTAGIYMLARLNLLYMFAPDTMLVVAVIGAVTAFVAAYVGLTQRGIKKILAYSTVSQLGYMFLAMGVGAFAGGIFHVFTHAFFKACLFLGAGSIIHALHHQEDVMKMGGLLKKMPLTAYTYGIATLAIAGFPLLAGFWSKDEILYMTFVAGQGNGLYILLYILAVITAAFTAFYMGRSFVLAFLGKPRMSEEKYSHVHESPINMTGVLVTLAIASALVGFLNVPKGIIDLGDYNAKFHHFLAPVTDRGPQEVAYAEYGVESVEAALGPVVIGNLTKDGSLYADYHGPELLLAFISIVIALGGLAFAWYVYTRPDFSLAERLQKTLSPLYYVSWKAWLWDDIYNAVFVNGMYRIYEGVLWADRTIIDGAVNGVGYLSKGIGNEFRRLQNGQVQIYGLMMFLGACLFLLYFALGLSGYAEQDRREPTPPRSSAAVIQQAPAIPGAEAPELAQGSND